MRLVLYFLFGSSTLFAQPDLDQLLFKNYSVADGLSENSVNCIVKADDGSVWIGTDEGLNHFDGHTFTIYRNKANDVNSISNNGIRALKFDNEKNLWISTVNGLNRYNNATDDFKVFRDSSSGGNNIADILIDHSRNCIWLADVESGLKYLDLKTGKIIPVEISGQNEYIVWKLLFDPDQNLILATLDRGVIRFAPENNSAQAVQVLNTFSQPSLSNNIIRDIVLKDGILWIGTQGGGVNKLNLLTNSLTIYSTDEGNLGYDIVWSLAMDDQHTLWVGTDGGGLNRLDTKREVYSVHLPARENPQSLSGNTIRSIYIDDEANVWLGTFDNGFDYYHQAMGDFRHYGESLNVTAFIENKDGIVLIGTDGTGLFEFDPLTKRLSESQGVSCNKIMAICEDPGGGVWMGTYQEGLHYKDGTEYKVFTPNNSTIIDLTIWSLATDTNGNLWMGTDEGACWFDRKSRTFKNFNSLNNYKDLFPSSLVRSVYVDKKGIIWLGSTSSIVGYNPHTETFTRYSSDHPVDSLSISSSLVISMMEKNGYLWTGTFGDGLNRINLITGKVDRFNEETGFPNNTIFSIEEGTEGYLWLGTNKGIVKLDPKKNEFVSYGPELSLSNNRSSLQNSNGLMFFGGNNGFTEFLPGSVRNTSDNIKPAFTGMLTQSNSTNLQPIMRDENGTVKLTYSMSRYLGFSVSGFYYLSPKAEVYAYRLPGFNENWREIGDRRTIIFTNLDPGNYTLEVKAGVNKQWSKNIATLPITILAPWWMTNYFRAGIILMIGMAVVLYNRARLKTLKRRKEELENLVLEKSREIQSQADELMVQNEELTAQNEQIVQQSNALEEAQRSLTQANSKLESTVEKRTDELRQAYKELDTFFYRSSHDFRRPLTTFMGLAEVAKISTTDPFILDLFKKVDQTARSLDKMIHKLQSISDLEWEQMMYKEIDLNSMIDDVFYLYREELNQKKIRTTTDMQVKDVRTYPALLKIVLENLVENSILFSRSENPGITVRSIQQNESVIIEVEDNGEGIIADYHKKIFDMYFRASSNSKGNGLGLYITKKAITKLNGSIEFKSEFDSGSTFRILLPV